MDILRVNMTDRRVTREPLDAELADWGGRGLCARLITAEVPPTCAPLGPFNKLVFAGGPLAGLGVSSAGRLSVGSKSPLTGGIKESNAGGMAGDKLCRVGLRAVVVEGQPAEGASFILRITREEAELTPAGDLAGKGNYALSEELRARFGQSICTITIGPAGERRLSAAGIAVSDADGQPGRFSARGGLGAVMGSKGLKAIVIDDTGGQAPRAAQRQEFGAARKRYSSAILGNEVTSKLFSDLGTAHMIPVSQEFGCLPTRNFSSGRFEHAEALSGESLRELIVSRGGQGRHGHACMSGCLIRCSNVIPDASGTAIVAPMEYETMAMFGPNLGIGDLDAIAHLNRVCNDLGVDTIDMGAAIGVAMEAGLAAFGDAAAALALLEEVGRETVLARVLGNGVAVTGRVLGVNRVPAVKGQAFSAYDPRATHGMGVTYATSPMGADHTAGYAMFVEKDLGGPVPASRYKQIESAAQDTLGVCQFTGSATDGNPMLLVDLVNALYGTRHGADYLDRLGTEVLRLELAFNRAAGLSAAHDRLPEFCQTEKLPEIQRVFDVSDEDLDTTLALELS